MKPTRKGSKTRRRTYNVRIDKDLIEAVDELVAQFNVDSGLRDLGHIYSRSDVLRAVIRFGIPVARQVLPAPAPEPLVSRPDSQPETPNSVDTTTTKHRSE